LADQQGYAPRTDYLMAVPAAECPTDWIQARLQVKPRRFERLDVVAKADIQRGNDPVGAET
jgi:hypothetical protein